MTDQELLQAIRAAVKEETEPLRKEIQALKKDIQEVKVTQELKVIPGLSILAEGHENILEHLQEKITDKTEDIQDQVDALSIVVKQHSRDIRQLKKAQ